MKIFCIHASKAFKIQEHVRVLSMKLPSFCRDQNKQKIISFHPNHLHFGSFPIYLPTSQYPQPLPMILAIIQRFPSFHLLLKDQLIKQQKWGFAAAINDWSLLIIINQAQFQKQSMSAIVPNDANTVQLKQAEVRGVKAIPMGQFSMEKVGSLDVFKSKLIDFKALRPAVLSNGVLYVQKGVSKA